MVADKTPESAIPWPFGYKPQEHSKFPPEHQNSPCLVKPVVDIGEEIEEFHQREWNTKSPADVPPLAQPPEIPFAPAHSLGLSVEEAGALREALKVCAGLSSTDVTVRVLIRKTILDLYDLLHGF